MRGDETKHWAESYCLGSEHNPLSRPRDRFFLSSFSKGFKVVLLSQFAMTSDGSYAGHLLPACRHVTESPMCGGAM